MSREHSCVHVDEPCVGLSLAVLVRLTSRDGIEHASSRFDVAQRSTLANFDGGRGAARTSCPDTARLKFHVHLVLDEYQGSGGRTSSLYVVKCVHSSLVHSSRTVWALALLAKGPDYRVLRGDVLDFNWT